MNSYVIYIYRTHGKISCLWDYTELYNLNY